MLPECKKADDTEDEKSEIQKEREKGNKSAAEYLLFLLGGNDLSWAWSKIPSPIITFIPPTVII